MPIYYRIRKFWSHGLEYAYCYKQHIFFVKEWKNTILSEGGLESLKLEELGTSLMI